MKNLRLWEVKWPAQHHKARKCRIQCAEPDDLSTIRRNFPHIWCISSHGKQANGVNLALDQSVTNFKGEIGHIMEPLGSLEILSTWEVRLSVVLHRVVGWLHKMESVECLALQVRKASKSLKTRFYMENFLMKSSQEAKAQLVWPRNPRKSTEYFLRISHNHWGYSLT